MSGFSFIHAADLHLGSPLSGLANRDADLARRLATAGRQAFEDLVTQAIERSVTGPTTRSACSSPGRWAASTAPASRRSWSAATTTRRA
jgi:hypothetical protein